VTWLVLTGYMGAGKSSVGRRVAARLDRTFVDADTAIEAHAEMSIPEIFAKRGEVWFRRTEEDVIRDLLATEPHGVLALGGGAVENAKTRGLVHRTAKVVWLRVGAEVAWNRQAAHLVVDAEEPLDHVVVRVADWARRSLTAEPTL
jgi:shikimate kinase